MRLLMAISADGFISRGSEDNMLWLGPTDKGIFKLLTYQGRNPVMVRSKRTELAMPKVLPGRRMITVSRRSGTGMDLMLAHTTYPDAWLIGGQTLAHAAIVLRLVTEAFLCVSSRYAFDGIESMLDQYLIDGGVSFVGEIVIADVKVKHYLRR